MCKYCKLEEIGENEYENKVRCYPIIKIKDGSYMTELCLDRYIAGNDTHESNLRMETVVKFDNGYHETIKTKYLKIKYCPFCGEKL